jgi:phosphoribosyl-ATP pyrophosphohydrolase
MNISDFESHVNGKILDRGEEYYLDDCVGDGEELDTGAWSSFRVSGGAGIYDTAVRLSSDGEIMESSCTCPYDMGPVCKHEVAVYFVLRDILSREDRTRDSVGTRPKRDKKTVREKVDAVLADFCETDLREFVVEHALVNTELRKTLLSKYVMGHVGAGKKKKEYKKLIREALYAGMNHGFIDYWGAGTASSGVEELLQDADEMLGQNRVEEAVSVYEAALEEVVPALQHADDSNGELGDIIYHSLEKLRECAEHMRDEKMKAEFFKSCLRASASDTYEGWSEWRWEWLDIALHVASGGDEREALVESADALSGRIHDTDSLSGRYDRECAAKLKLKMVEKWDGKKQAEQFLFENMEHTSMREAALEMLFKKKDYEAAKRIAEEGVALDTKRGCPGLVRQWREWLLRIAQTENDVEHIRRYARQVFLEGRGEFQYYDIFKNTFSKSAWRRECDALLKEIAKTERGDSYTVCQVYVREKRWESLFDVVRKNPSAGMLDAYYQYLKKRYPEELVEMYEQAVREELKHTGRGVYQSACQKLEKMREFGGQDTISALIDEFRVRYKNRPALWDELKSNGFQ